MARGPALFGNGFLKRRNGPFVNSSQLRRRSGGGGKTKPVPSECRSPQILYLAGYWVWERQGIASAPFRCFLMSGDGGQDEAHSFADLIRDSRAVNAVPIWLSRIDLWSNRSGSFGQPVVGGRSKLNVASGC